MAPGFEEVELTAPVDILRRLGIPVTTAGVKGRLVEGAHGMVVQADMLLVDVEPELFDGVILPGGAAAWLLRDTPAVIKLVKSMHAANKLVGAICAAPIVLEAAEVLKGRHVTCFPSNEVTDALASVADIADAPAVTDGLIVTGRGPGAAFEFGFALAAALGMGAQAEALRRDMCLAPSLCPNEPKHKA